MNPIDKGLWLIGPTHPVRPTALLNQLGGVQKIPCLIINLPVRASDADKPTVGKAVRAIRVALLAHGAYDVIFPVPCPFAVGGALVVKHPACNQHRDPYFFKSSGPIVMQRGTALST